MMTAVSSSEVLSRRSRATCFTDVRRMFSRVFRSFYVGLKCFRAFNRVGRTSHLNCGSGTAWHAWHHGCSQIDKQPTCVYCRSGVVANRQVLAKASNVHHNICNVPHRFDDSAVGIFEFVRIIRGVVVAIEVPPVVHIRRHRINAEEPPNLRIVIALNKVTRRDFRLPMRSTPRRGAGFAANSPYAKVRSP